MLSVWCLAELQPPIQPATGKITSLLLQRRLPDIKMFIKIYLKYYCVSVERRLFTATRMNILNSISPGECCREAELLGVICCWIVARLEHLPSWCDHGRWGNEQRDERQNREQVTTQHSYHLQIVTCTSPLHCSRRRIYKSLVREKIFFVKKNICNSFSFQPTEIVLT